MESFKPLLAKVAAGAELSRAEAFDAFEAMRSGDVTPAQIGGLLMGLRVRGEGVEEITGAVAAMRARMLKVKAPDGAIDIVGTGGDGAGSYNVSTLASIIVAACGVPVAKHGNRAASSKSGASDVLTALGVKIGLPPEGVERCIAEAGVGFMMATTHHAAMRHVGAARVELGTRTIFNLLGPALQPGRGQTPGDRRILCRLARTDGASASQSRFRAGLVLPRRRRARRDHHHRADRDRRLREGEIRTFSVAPEDVGLRRASLAELKGGDPAHNAKALREVLSGAKSAHRDVALLNAAAGLVVAGAARDLREGVAVGAAALDSGAASATLAKLVEASNA